MQIQKEIQIKIQVQIQIQIKIKYKKLIQTQILEQRHIDLGSWQFKKQVKTQIQIQTNTAWCIGVGAA